MQKGSAARISAVDKLCLNEISVDDSIPLVLVNRIANKVCELRALVDTGSPVCLLKRVHYENYLEKEGFVLQESDLAICGLRGTRLKTFGVVFIEIQLDALKGESLQ